MTILDIARVQASAQQLDFGKMLRWLGAFLVKLLVLVIAAVPFLLGWAFTMIVKIAIAGAQEGVRSATVQLTREGGS